jgi:hypothetical protein
MQSDAWLMVVIVLGALGVLGGAVLARRRRVAGGPATSTPLEHQVQMQAAELRRIADQGAQRELASEQLRQGLEGARRALDALRTREQERRRTDQEQREVIGRLATVLAGGAGKGRAGEHLLREHLAELPPDMLVTDVRVNGKVVEFGLVLPDGRRLPIDSKWTALAEVEALEAATDPVERDACARAVERATAVRVKEVAQYLDPAITAPVAIAAVPDAVYAALKRVHAEAYGKGVVIVPYSSALPIVLFLYALVRRYGDAAGVQSSLSEVAAVLDVLESVVENRFQKAAVMLTNGADEFRSQLGKARGSIARAHVVADGGAGDPSAEPNLSVVG